MRVAFSSILLVFLLFESFQLNSYCEERMKFIDTDIDWLDSIFTRLKTVYIDKLVYKGCFVELHKSVWGDPYPAGIWGFNTWAGIHDLIPIVDDKFRSILRNTFDKGLENTDPSTGLLPHAILTSRNEEIGYVYNVKRVEYKCYGGIHGEDYNLDNMNYWAHMILLYYLYTLDDTWFTDEKLLKVEKSVDYIISHFMAMYNPDLVEVGIEGDWTENTNWHADNANVNVNMYYVLRLLAQVERLKGKSESARYHDLIAERIKNAFNKEVSEGGFWDSKRGVYVHGNDGRGGRVYGDKYFETTANIFAILYGIAESDKVQSILRYMDMFPDIESPWPVKTNYPGRTDARRTRYLYDVTNGDVWFFLGAHTAVVRLKNGYREKGTKMYKVIRDYEEKEGTIHNNIYGDGSVNADWSPELGNYGGLFTPYVEGVLGLRPTEFGLIISPTPLEGMTYLKTLNPLFYAGKNFYLSVEWKGENLSEVYIDEELANNIIRDKDSILLRPSSFRNGSEIKMVFKGGG
jgi:hypothetical protein